LTTYWCRIATRRPAIRAVTTLRFSALGITSVAAILVTGIVNARFLVGTIARLIDTEYGQLLLTKIMIFAVMVAIAAFNRLRLTPRLPDRPHQAESWTVLLQLRRNSLVEASFDVMILSIVGTLGMLMPAMHHGH
jgi:putative copper resistance protein D